jgi:translation initiation factor 5B
MRDPRDKFKQVNNVMAAAGVKITSPDLEGILAGSPLYVYDNSSLQKKDKEEFERLKSLVESEVKNAIVSNTQTTGLILKCDTIGSLEAIVDLLEKANVAIKIADIGNITRRDVIEAAAVKENDRYLGVILGFNVKVFEDAQKEAQDRGVKIFNERIIYNLVRGYTEWVAYQREHEESILFNELPPICKFQFLKGFIFRRSDPAVFGAEVQIGRLRQKVHIINEEGKKIGIVHQIQESGKAIDEASVGMQVAVSLKEPTIGRQINEGDIFYTDLNSRQAKQLLERFNHRLNDQEKEVLNTLVTIKRKSDSTFGYL